MPVDPTGTSPGLMPGAETPKPVHIKCRNPSCDSILAIEIKIAEQGGGLRLYQCQKCKATRSIPVGGAVDL